MIQRDSTGRIYAPGRRSVQRWEASSGALPAWLALGASGNDASSTLTFGGAGPDAYARLSPTNVAGRTATIAAASVSLTDITLLRVTVESTSLSHKDFIGWNIGAWDDSATSGGRITLPTAISSESPYVTLGSFPLSSSTNPIPDATNYAPRNNAEYKKPRTLSYIMTPQDRRAYAFEGDSCFAAWQHARMDMVDPVIPRLRTTVQSTTARYLQFTAFELEIVRKG